MLVAAEESRSAVRAVRRTAAGSQTFSIEATTRGRFADETDDEPGVEDDSDNDRVPGPKPHLQPKISWRSCGRALRIVDVPAVAVVAGVLIWTGCFLMGDDPFAIFLGTEGPGVAGGAMDAVTTTSEVAGGSLILKESQGPLAMQGSSATASSSESWPTGAGASISSLFHGFGNFTVASGDHNATDLHELNLSVAASNEESTWFSRLTGANANGSSATFSRMRFERLRAGGKKLKEQSEERLRWKQEELRKKGDEVTSASLALAGAISTGKVQRWVVIGAVAAFFACGAVLQLLSSARGTLRQVVRAAIARSLPVSLAPNELVTRPYANWAELMVRVSLDFLNEPANLMLVSIGSLQVVATWSKHDPWRCKKINLLVLLLNFGYTIVQEVRAQWLAAKHDEAWNSSPCTRSAGPGRPSETVPAKDICVGDVVKLQHGDLCPATGELVGTSHSFVLFNSLCETGEDCCSILSVGDMVLRGFVSALEGAEVQVRVTETRNGSRLPAGKTPEDNGEAKQATSALPTPRPVPPKSRRMERFPEHMNGPLMQANLASLALLFCASVLCCALSYRSSGDTTPAPGGEVSESLSVGGSERREGELSQTERLLVTHFFSAAVQLNTVIPSMRWVVLFFLFVFLVEAARPDVSIQNWRAFQGMEHRLIMYSDKTGTLTEVGMHVARLRLVDSGADLAPATPSPPTQASGASPSNLALSPRSASAAAASLGEEAAQGLAWLGAVLMACNDSQPRPKERVGVSEGGTDAPASGAAYLGLRPGTSPEEIAVAEHLEFALGLAIELNPLQPGASSSARPSAAGSSASAPEASQSDSRAAQKAVHHWPLVLRDVATGLEVARARIPERSGFDAARGCREAIISFGGGGGVDRSDDCWLVRQGGADVVAELAGRSAREAELATEDRDRALGWAVARIGADGSRAGAWSYVLRASFANPPRAASAQLVQHCRDSKVAVRVLTGDAGVAALHISREIGVFGGPSSASSSSSACPSACLCHEPGESASKFGARVAARIAASELPGEAICVAVPGAIVREQVLAGDGTDAWLADERTSAVIYRTRASDKALIVRHTEELGRERRRRAAADAAASAGLGGRRAQCLARKGWEEGVCWMIGDAANDAEAICLEEVVGVSLRHGAAPCRLGADFVVDGPGGVIAVRTELRGRALAGARWLLGDTCQLCGMVSALTFCGVWTGRFSFLPRGFLYDDPFDARIMTLFSGVLYPFSACAAACCVGGGVPSVQPFDSSSARGKSWPVDDPVGRATLGPVRSLMLGVALGAVLGLAGPMDDPVRFGRWMLGVISTTSFLRHVLAPFTLWTASCWPRAAASAVTATASPSQGHAFGKNSSQNVAAEHKPNFVAEFLAKVGNVKWRGLAICLYLLISQNI